MSIDNNDPHDCFEIENKNSERDAEIPVGTMTKNAADVSRNFPTIAAVHVEMPLDPSSLWTNNCPAACRWKAAHWDVLLSLMVESKHALKKKNGTT